VNFAIGFPDLFSGNGITTRKIRLFGKKSEVAKLELIIMALTPHLFISASTS